MLMLGRLLGGIAYSLLFSVFEAWLIDTHNKHGIKSYLSKSFGYAAYANSVIAIVAGLVAHHAASSNKMTPVQEELQFLYTGGYLNPFDIALFALVACGFLAMTLWEENYGDDNSHSKHSTDSKWYEGLKNAFTTTVRSHDIWLCGLISSLFEGSMYIFVFMWTPALTAAAQSSNELPFGLIFSTFMVCCMAGSSLFSIQIEIFKVERLAVWVLAVATVSMALIAAANDMTLKFIAMNLFELTIGMYFPIIGTMKSMVVPDSNRAAIYNLFRIPLNFIVLFSLLTDLTPRQSFGLNCVMLSTATVLQYILMKRRELNGMPSGDDTDTDDDEPQLDEDLAILLMEMQESDI
jgi:MFS family permease